MILSIEIVSLREMLHLNNFPYLFKGNIIILTSITLLPFCLYYWEHKEFLIFRIPFNKMQRQTKVLVRMAIL